MAKRKTPGGSGMNMGSMMAKAQKMQADMQAAQAEVDVLTERAVQIHASVRRRLHELDAPAGAVHLGVEHGIAGTRGQTEAAVNTLVKQALVVRRGHGCRCLHAGYDSTEKPPLSNKHQLVSHLPV